MAYLFVGTANSAEMAAQTSCLNKHCRATKGAVLGQLGVCYCHTWVSVVERHKTGEKW